MVLALFVTGHVLAQDSTHMQKMKKDEGEIKTEGKPTSAVKVVPSARGKSAKPAKINPANARSARPGGTRPARNARPSNRPARPGAGRN